MSPDYAWGLKSLGPNSKLVLIFPQSPEFSKVKVPKRRIGIEKFGDEEIKMKRGTLAFLLEGKYQSDKPGTR